MPATRTYLVKANLPVNRLAANRAERHGAIAHCFPEQPLDSGGIPGDDTKTSKPLMVKSEDGWRRILVKSGDQPEEKIEILVGIERRGSKSGSLRTSQ